MDLVAAIFIGMIISGLVSRWENSSVVFRLVPYLYFGLVFYAFPSMLGSSLDWVQGALVFGTIMVALGLLHDWIQRSSDRSK